MARTLVIGGQLDYVRLLGTVAGREPRIVHVPREELVRRGGQLMTQPYCFGACLDVPPITVKNDRARSELGLELIPLEEGLRETFRWYQEQQRPEPDLTWEAGF